MQIHCCGCSGKVEGVNTFGERVTNRCGMHDSMIVVLNGGGGGRLSRMKLFDVLKEPTVLSGEDWFRPITWRGARAAYCLQDGHTWAVPDPRGGYLTFTTDVQLLVGDWEVVNPGTVIEGW